MLLKKRCDFCSKLVDKTQVGRGIRRDKRTSALIDRIIYHGRLGKSDR